MTNKPFTPRSILDNPKTAHHGALNYRELDTLNIEPDQIIDFSSNINPYGPAPEMLKLLSTLDISKYPDRESIALRSKLAEENEIGSDHILVGNGSAELIWIFAFTFIQPGNKVLIFGPTFGEYERCVSLMGGKVEWLNSLSEDEFEFNPQLVHHTLKEKNPQFCFICNPNNPTGNVIPLEDIRKIAEAFPSIGIIVDEAYLPFVPGLPSVVSLGLPNLLVLRSMTKDHSLAGLRLGYAIGPVESIERMAKSCPAWNVNSLAQSAGLVALSQKPFLMESNAKLRIEKQKLVTGIKEQGFTVFKSDTQYFLIEVGDATVFRQSLLVNHLLQVRDCTSFGLPSMVRVSTRRRKDNQKLIDAMGRMTL